MLHAAWRPSAMLTVTVGIESSRCPARRIERRATSPAVPRVVRRPARSRTGKAAHADSTSASRRTQLCRARGSVAYSARTLTRQPGRTAAAPAVRRGTCRVRSRESQTCRSSIPPRSTRSSSSAAAPPAAWRPGTSRARASTSSCSMPGRSSTAASTGRTSGPGRRASGGRAARRRRSSSSTRKEQPYFTPQERQFDLTRVWGHGGKTNVWGRVSLRLSDLDFKGAETDGWEIPWPIAYKDIAPVLRSGRAADRRLRRHRRFRFAAGQQVPAAAAGAALRRAAAAEGRGQGRHPDRRRAARRT